ncbi:hypothetical protein [Streptomyces sp. SGAir0957]
MSPILLDADAAHTPEGEKARATTLIAVPSAFSISDLFTRYAAARESGDEVGARRILRSVGPQLADELDGFNYPAAA